MDIRAADVATVRPLQQAVLRPHGPLPTDAPLPGPPWCHLAAWDGTAVVGVVSAGPQPWARPDLVELPTPTWHLRSMAVAAEHRRRGIGAALLQRLVEEAAAAGAASLWAEARVGALSLYERHGWHAVGQVWDKPGVGPHRYIWIGT